MTKQSNNFERTMNCNADSQCDSVYVSALSDRQARVSSTAERQVPGQNQGDLVGRQIIPNVEIESGDKNTGRKTDWATARVEARQQSEANIMNGNPVHHVRFGDCLWDIASASFHKNNGHKPSAGEIMGEVNRLAKKNNIADANNIAVGTAIDTSSDKAVRPQDRPQTSWQTNDQSGRAPNYYDFNGGRRNDAYQQGTNYYNFNGRSNLGQNNSNYYEFNGNPSAGPRTDYRLGDYFDRWQHPNNQNNPLVRLPNISDRQPSSNVPEVRPDSGNFGPRNIDPGMEVRPQAKNTTTWRNAHNELVAKARRGAPNVAFYGDSITQGLQLNSGFKTSFGRTENFGIGGDTNQNLLFRLQNGEADFQGGKPETAVLLIGTNNIGSQTPDKIAAGILANARELTNRLPGAEVVVMGILPRGYSANDPLRRQVNAVNEIVRQELQGVPGVKFVDIAPQLLDGNGNMRAGVFQKDNVHLTYNTGYSTMLQALRPHIRSGR